MLLLYRVTAPEAVHCKTRMPIDTKVYAIDRFMALREACIEAGYTSPFHAAKLNGLEIDRWRQEVHARVIPDTGLSFDVPLTEAAYDWAMWTIEAAVETVPDGVVRAVEHWLANERLKRRRGEQKDHMDVSWLPALIASYQGYLRVVGVRFPGHPRT